MTILAIFSKRRSLLTSIEDSSPTSITIQDGTIEETPFSSLYSQNPAHFTIIEASITTANFETIKALAGTTEAAFLLANKTDVKPIGRTCVYIENGSLKIA